MSNADVKPDHKFGEGMGLFKYQMGFRYVYETACGDQTAIDRSGMNYYDIHRPVTICLIPVPSGYVFVL